MASGVTIAGFTKNDTIDLTDFAATAASYTAGTGLVLRNASATTTIDLTGSLSHAAFSVHSDGAGGTVIEDVTCYAQGTNIATPDGEVAVEALKIGMEVKTLYGGTRRIK